MALDVDRTLQEIMAAQGGRSADEAKKYVKALVAAKRYRNDVY